MPPWDTIDSFFEKSPPAFFQFASRTSLFSHPHLPLAIVMQLYSEMKAKSLEPLFITEAQNNRFFEIWGKIREGNKRYLFSMKHATLIFLG